MVACMLHLYTYIDAGHLEHEAIVAYVPDLRGVQHKVLLHRQGHVGGEGHVSSQVLHSMQGWAW